LQRVVAVRHPQGGRIDIAQAVSRRLLHHVQRDGRRRPSRVEAEPPRDDAVDAIRAITTGAMNCFPSRVESVTRSSSSCACAMSAPAMIRLQPRPQARRAVRRSRRGESSARPGAPARIVVDRPSGPSRCNLETAWVAIRDNSRLRYGNLLRARALIPPPHGLLRGTLSDRAAGREFRPKPARGRRSPRQGLRQRR